MGIHHGGLCVGCCWALMVVLFPLGMMNLLWMGLFTLVMYLEKNIRYGVVIGRVAGGVLLASGIVLLLMGSVFLVAELLGRQRNAVAAISFAGAVMVAYQPHVLWDASFQLSFLSMLGLIFISHYLIHSMQPEAVTGSNKYLQSIKGIMITGFGTTMAAIIATWPVTALDFRSFSLVGAPATFFAMPSFPPIILTSMLTSFAGTLWQPSGILFGWVSWLFLSYFILVVNLFGAIPVAYITNVAIQPWQAISYYGALAALLVMLNKRQAVSVYCKRLYEKVRSVLSGLKVASLKPYIYWALAILVVANTLVWTAYATVPDGKLHVSVLDVGQGESILIRTPDGQNIVVNMRRSICLSGISKSTSSY